MISNPTSPSDAMNIVLDLLREIVVDHVLHIRDIQATSSNRRSYEYWGTAVTKISQSIFALLLASVSKMDESVCKLKNLTFIFDLSKRIILLSFTLITIAKMRYTDDYCTRTVPSTSILTLSVVHRPSVYRLSFVRLSFVCLSSLSISSIIYASHRLSSVRLSATVSASIDDYLCAFCLSSIVSKRRFRRHSNCTWEHQKVKILDWIVWIGPIESKNFPNFFLQFIKFKSLVFPLFGPSFGPRSLVEVCGLHLCKDSPFLRIRIFALG